MRKFLTFVLVTLVVSHGCGPQAPFDPDDEVVIHGVYQDQAGSALVDQWVGFWINSPESFFTNFLGLDPEESDKTNSSGAYSEEFMGKDLMNNWGATFKVVVMNYDTGWPDTNPKVACDFFPLSTDIEVPTMKLWHGNPNVTFDDTNAVFTWANLSDTLESEPDKYTLQVKATQEGGGYTLWQEDVGRNTSFTIPIYVLPEAYVSKWRVVARIAAPSQSEFGYTYLTAPDTTDIPDNPYQLLSLGKNCYAEAFSQTFPEATDGKWGPWPTYCVVFTATNVSWVYVDLGDTKQTVNAVVLYGMTIIGNPTTPGYDVYVSNDTTSWGTAVTANSQKNGYFYIEGFSQQGRYVKLQAKDDTIGITGFREIGIFGQ
jgi:hypothetical protein